MQSIREKRAPLVENDPYLARNLAEIERCAMEAMQTVRENLAHLRPIRLEPVYLAARLSEAIEAASLPPGIEIRQEGLERLPLVVAGVAGWTFVFTNLLENAADAMRRTRPHRNSRPGPARIGLKSPCAIPGPGIPPELAERIFELNVSGRAASRPGKLGFGLWWVKTLMTRLGGSIELENGGERGACFRLRLPRHKENA